MQFELVSFQEGGIADVAQKLVNPFQSGSMGYEQNTLFLLAKS